MPKRRVPLTHMPVEIEVGGKMYSGYYTIDRGIITVHSTSASKPAELRNTSADALARIILRELVNEGKG